MHSLTEVRQRQNARAKNVWISFVRRKVRRVFGQVPFSMPLESIALLLRRHSGLALRGFLKIEIEMPKVAYYK